MVDKKSHIDEIYSLMKFPILNVIFELPYGWKLTCILMRGNMYTAVHDDA
jgi:hypothetical protein